jgi:hypothetical protein
MAREYVCRNAACPHNQEVASGTIPRDEPVQLCGECGQPLEVALFPVAPIWVGPISAKYLDRTKEGGNARDGSHWLWDKDPVTGKKSPVLVETWSQQKELCKRNGLALPSEMPNNFEVAGDGRTVKNTMGLPGSEV